MTGSEMNKLTVANMQVEALRKQLADAQATVEALQRERKQAEQKHLQDVAYMRSQYDSIVAMKDEVQAALDAEREKVKELKEWQRVVVGTGTDQEAVVRMAATEYTKTAVQCWKDENAKLTAQLATLQAQLAEIEQILCIESGKTTVDKVRDLHHSFKQVWNSYQSAVNELFDTQAQLRQVEGQSKQQAKEAVIVFAKYTTLRQLVAQLPVVKGDVVIEPPWVGQVGGTYDVRVRQQVNNTMTSVRIAQFHIKEDAEAFAALLTHRAWMNYATLAAKDAGKEVGND